MNNNNEEEKTQTVLQVEKIKIYSQHDINNKDEQDQQKDHVLQQQQQQQQQQEQQSISAAFQSQRREVEQENLILTQNLENKQTKQQLGGAFITPSMRASENYLDDKSPANSQQNNTQQSQFSMKQQQPIYQKQEYEVEQQQEYLQQQKIELSNQNKHKQIEYGQEQIYHDSSRSQQSQLQQYYDQQGSDQEHGEIVQYQDDYTQDQMSPTQIQKKGKVNLQSYQDYYQGNEGQEKGQQNFRNNPQLDKAQYIHSLAYYDPSVNSKIIKKRAGVNEVNDVSLQDLLNQNQYSLASSINVNNSTSNYSSSKKSKPTNTLAASYGNINRLQEKVEDRLMKMAQRKVEKIEQMRRDRDQQFLLLSKGKSPEKNVQNSKYIAYQNNHFASMAQQNASRNEQNNNSSYEGIALSQQKHLHQLSQNQNQQAIQVFNQYQAQYQHLASHSTANHLSSQESIGIDSDYISQQQLQQYNVLPYQTSSQQKNQARNLLPSDSFSRLTVKKALKYQFKPNIFSASQTSHTVNRRDEIKKDYLNKTKELLFENSYNIQQYQSSKAQQAQALANNPEAHERTPTSYKVNQNSQSILSNSSSPSTLAFKRLAAQENINQSVNSSKQYIQQPQQQQSQQEQSQQQQKQYYSPERNADQNYFDQIEMRANKNKVITNLFDSAERVKHQKQQQQLEAEKEQLLQQTKYYQQYSAGYINMTPKQVQGINQNLEQNNQSLQQTGSKEFSFNQTGFSNNRINNQSSPDKMIFYSDKMQDLKYLQTYSPNFKAKYGAKYIPQTSSANNDTHLQEYVKRIASQNNKASVNNEYYYVQQNNN